MPRRSEVESRTSDKVPISYNTIKILSTYLLFLDLDTFKRYLHITFDEDENNQREFWTDPETNTFITAFLDKPQAQTLIDRAIRGLYCCDMCSRVGLRTQEQNPIVSSDGRIRCPDELPNG